MNGYVDSLDVHFRDAATNDSENNDDVHDEEQEQEEDEEEQQQQRGYRRRGNMDLFRRTLSAPEPSASAEEGGSTRDDDEDVMGIRQRIPAAAPAPLRLGDLGLGHLGAAVEEQVDEAPLSLSLGSTGNNLNSASSLPLPTRKEHHNRSFKHRGGSAWRIESVLGLNTQNDDDNDSALRPRFLSRSDLGSEMDTDIQPPLSRSHSTRMATRRALWLRSDDPALEEHNQGWGVELGGKGNASDDDVLADSDSLLNGGGVNNSDDDGYSSDAASIDSVSLSSLSSFSTSSTHSAFGGASLSTGPGVHVLGSGSSWDSRESSGTPRQDIEQLVLESHASLLSKAKQERDVGYYYYKHVEGSPSATIEQEPHRGANVRQDRPLTSDFVVMDSSTLAPVTADPPPVAVRVAAGSQPQQRSSQQLPAITRVRDWNSEFQSLLDRLHALEPPAGAVREDGSVQNAKLALYTQLAALVQDFNYTAKTYGKIIILERYSAVKTIAPIDIGGIGGGEKYAAAGILFKFAVDRYGLYGDDEFSAKAAGNELKGLLSFYQARVPEIHVPLMTLVDFRGFRLVAQSIAPLQRLLYGSDDGGSTVHTDDPVLNEAMRVAASRIGLKGHIAGLGRTGEKKENPHLAEPKMIYGPTDIEGHIGTDGRYYLLDFARTMPPEAPSHGARRRSVLWQLLRPEFVSRYTKMSGGGRAPNGLSSDGLTGFGGRDPLASEHNRELRHATHTLHTVFIPKVALQLDRMSGPALLRVRLLEVIHKAGVNTRHLGCIRAYSREERVKTFLLTHMIARVVKCELSRMLRLPMAPDGRQGNYSHTNSTQQPYKMAISELFNTIVGAGGERSDMWWRIEIKQLLNDKFTVYGRESSPMMSILTSNEMNPDNRLDHLCKVNMFQLFELIQDITQIRVSDRALAALREQQRTLASIDRRRSSTVASSSPNANQFGFVYPDIERLGLRVKDMNIASHAEGMALFAQSMQVSGVHDSPVHSAVSRSQPNAEAADRLFNLAASKLESASSTMLDNRETISAWADVLFVQAKTKHGKARSDLVMRALERLQSIHAAAELVNMGNLIEAEIQDSMLSGRERDQSYVLAALAYGGASTVLDSQRSDEPDALADNSQILDPVIVLAKWAALLIRYASIKGNMVDAQTTMTEAGRYLKKCCRLLTSEGNGRIGGDSALGSLEETILEVSHLKATNLADMEFAGLFHVLSRLRQAQGSDPSSGVNADLSSFHPPVSSAVVKALTATRVSPSIISLKVHGFHIKSASSVSASSREMSLNFHTREVLEPTESLTTSILLFRGLQSLTFVDCHFFDDQEATLLLTSKSLPDLNSLVIQNCPRVSSLGGPKEVFFPLRTLHLLDCARITDDVVDTVALFAARLEDLNLSGCRRVTDVGISKIARLCSKLQKLTLSGTSSSTSGGKWLMEIGDREKSTESATSSSALDFINFSGLAGLTEIALSSFFGSRFKEMRSIRLAGCSQLMDSHLKQISEHAGIAMSLEHLDVSRCKNVTDTGLGAIVSSCASLRSLLVNACPRVSDATLHQICETVDRGRPGLQVFEASSCFKLSQAGLQLFFETCAPTLTTVKLNGCDKVDDRCLAALAHEGRGGLQVLSLASTTHAVAAGITDVGLAELCDAAPELSILDVSGCKFVGDRTLRALSKRSPVRLVSISLGRSTRFTSLSLLHLVRLSVRTLKKLDLRFCPNQVTDATLTAIAMHVVVLEDLWLDNCQLVTDKSLERVGNYCHSLRSLRLASCPKVTDIGMTSVANGCPSLTYVGLQKNSKITDTSVRQLCSQCPRLQQLLLSNCPLVTNASCTAMADGLLCLSRVFLDGCRVSRKGFAAIDAAFPDCEVRKMARSVTDPDFRWGAAQRADAGPSSPPKITGPPGRRTGPTSPKRATTTTTTVANSATASASAVGKASVPKPRAKPTVRTTPNIAE